MANLFTFRQKGARLDYTPAAAQAASELIQVGKLPAIAQHAIAAGALGAIALGTPAEIWRGPKTACVGNVGDNVWWDANGEPAAAGTTTDGALTTDASAGDFWVGTLAAPAAATDLTADVRLGVQSFDRPVWPNKSHVATAVDLTWAAATHNGKVIHVTADAKTVTLPVGVAGMEVIVVNDVADGGALVTVDLNGNETIEGNLTIAATKKALNTKATAVRGDFLHLRCQTAASLWVCLEKRGIWVTD